MTLTTNPTGSLVYLNGSEVGRAPLNRDFTWYGTYYVTVRKEGYETLKTTQSVSAPWFQIIPVDLIAEIIPIWFEDHRYYHYTLVPSQDAPGNVPGPGLISRAEEMRSQLKGSERAATQP